MPQISPLSWIVIPFFLVFFGLVFMVGFWWFINERVFFIGSLSSSFVSESGALNNNFWMW